MEHTIPVQTGPWYWPVVLGAMLLIGMFTWIILAWRRGNRLPFFGVLMFLVPLAPASGIIAPINAVFYEHWLYLSLLGVAVLVAYYGVRVYIWLASKRHKLGVLMVVIAVVYGAWFVVQSIRRNLIWTNPERLYGEILEHEPENVRALNNLANLYAEQKRSDDAQEHWLRAAEADPTQPAPYHNLANLARASGDLERAQELYLKAIKVQATFHYAYRNLAGMLLEQERYSDAVQVLAKLRDLAPDDPTVHYSLAQALHLAGRDDLSIKALADGRQYANSPEAMRAYDRLEAELSP
jgi:Flp pilus assembly protein TadD